MTPDKPRRRWFRYSLRTLFVAVTVLAVWLGWQMSIIHHRQRLLDKYEKGWPNSGVGYAIDTEDEPWHGERLSLARKTLGDRLVRVVWTRADLPAEEMEELTAAFPEAEVYDHAGQSKGD